MSKLRCDTIKNEHDSKKKEKKVSTAAFINLHWNVLQVIFEDINDILSHVLNLSPVCCWFLDQLLDENQLEMWNIDDMFRSWKWISISNFQTNLLLLLLFEYSREFTNIYFFAIYEISFLLYSLTESSHTNEMFHTRLYTILCMNRQIQSHANMRHSLEYIRNFTE